MRGMSKQQPEAKQRIDDLVIALRHECDDKNKRIKELSGLLKIAHHALRSYEFCNGSPDLAKEVADKIEQICEGICGV